MTDVEIVTASVRAVEYAVPFLLSLKVFKRQWRVTVTAALGFSVAILGLVDNTLVLRSVLGMFLVGSICVLLVEMMSAEPLRVRAMLGARDQKWAGENHVLRNDLAAEQLKVRLLREQLDDTPPDRL